MLVGSLSKHDGVAEDNVDQKLTLNFTYEFRGSLKPFAWFITVKTVIVMAIAIAIVIFLGQFCPRGKDAMRLTLCKAPTRETRPDHNTGNYVPHSLR